MRKINITILVVAIVPTGDSLPFGECNEVFPNAACVVPLIDRLMHHSEVIAIRGDS